MKIVKIMSFCLAMSAGFAESCKQEQTEEINLLKNKKGFRNNIGLTIASYQYKEPGLMSIKGALAGIDYVGTYSFENSLFLKGDVSFAYANGKYTSNRSGSMNNDPSFYMDVRPLAGKNFVFERHALAPFAGLGYRVLKNDTSNETATTGHVGYNRVNRLVYLPLGLTHRFSLHDTAVLETTAEFDYLIQGKQYSGIDGGITNTQKKGYGLRFSTQYQTKRWSFGPYVKYWNIKVSDKVTRGITTFWEPKNTTVEGGIRASLFF